jgi:uncharacterized membrane protein YkoI
MFMNAKTKLSIAALLGYAAFSSFALAGEEKELTQKEMPQAVLEAFQKAYPKAKDVKYSEEKAMDGKMAYEVEFKEAGKEFEAVYSAEGTLIETEQEIKTAELPDAIVQAIRKAHPQAMLKEAEKIMRPDGTVRGYEVEIADGQKRLELELDAGGAILETEVED